MVQSRSKVFLALVLLAFVSLSVPASAQQDPANVEPVVSAGVGQFVSQVAFPIDSFSVAFLACIDAANQALVADFIMNNSGYPELNIDNPTFLAVHNLSDDPSVTQQQLDAFSAGLDALANIGACVAQVDWVSPTAGSFTTYAIVENDAVTYETMQLMVPTPWPIGGSNSNLAWTGPEAEPVPGVCREKINPAQDFLGAKLGQTESTNSSGEEIYENGFGVDCLKFNCTATADCQGATVIGCTGTHEAMGLCFGWAAEGSVASETVVGNCCRVKCNFGYASGFKSVKVGADGITVEITGILGVSGTFSRTTKACCQGAECETDVKPHEH